MSDDPLLGQLLDGRYRVHELLGAGGMGSVYRATHVLMDKTVALKVINAEVAHLPNVAKRFEREARSASRLADPHCISVTDFGRTEDGTLFLVMELLAGEELAARLAREGPLPPRQAIAVARQILKALGHAHAAGVVHRDLKPENVLFQSEHALLADFGVAHARLEGIRRSSGVQLGEMRRSIALSNGRLTQHGFAVGTPTYMAPEQFIGDDPADARSDVYALATLGYEMLTGAPPFAKYKGARLMVAHFTEQAPLASHVRDEVPVGVAQVLERGLAKEPQDRYDHAGAFRDALGGRW